MQNIKLKEIDPTIGFLTCMNKDLLSPMGFLLGLAATPDSSKYKTAYKEGMNHFSSWIVRAVIRLQILQLELQDTASTSILLEKEDARVVFEYDMDKFLAHVANKDLLIIEDYAVIRRVTERDAGNV